MFYVQRDQNNALIRVEAQAYAEAGLRDEAVAAYEQALMSMMMFRGQGHMSMAEPLATPGSVNWQQANAEVGQFPRGQVRTHRVHIYTRYTRTRDTRTRARRGFLQIGNLCISRLMCGRLRRGDAFL